MKQTDPQHGVRPQFLSRREMLRYAANGFGALGLASLLSDEACAAAGTEMVSNPLAVRLGSDLAAAAPFYGGPPQAADVAKIKAAILVHHGELDTRLAATWPAYDAALKAANVPHEGYIYPGAVHGFNCDATPERYNKAAADLAWQRTVDWFNKYVRG